MTAPDHDVAVAAFNARAQRFQQFGNQLTPEQFAVEQEYLIREQARLNAEAEQLAAAQRRAERRAAAVGVAGNVTKKTGSTFWSASFRSKIGVIGLVVLVMGFFAYGMGKGGALGGVGVGIIVLWLLMGMFGLGDGSGGGGGGGGYETRADQLRLESMRAAAERQAAADEREERLRAEAEQRRQEAIERAQQQVSGSDW